MKRLLISLAALALAGGANAAGSPVSEANSAAILAQLQSAVTKLQAQLDALNSGALIFNVAGSTLVYASPSGQSANGLATTVPAVSGSCAALKLTSGSLFFWSVSNAPVGDYIWVLDSPLAAPTGAVPQGSTPSTTVTELWPPIPVPANGHWDWDSHSYPRTFNGGAVICISTSATSLIPAGTPNVSGGVL